MGGPPDSRGAVSSEQMAAASVSKACRWTFKAAKDFLADSSNSLLVSLFVVDAMVVLL